MKKKRVKSFSFPASCPDRSAMLCVRSDNQEACSDICIWDKPKRTASHALPQNKGAGVGISVVG